LDLLCGGGDNAVVITRRAARHALLATMVGCDISPAGVSKWRSRAFAMKLSNVSFSA
jgi:hypothetical protein